MEATINATKEVVDDWEKLVERQVELAEAPQDPADQDYIDAQRRLDEQQVKLDEEIQNRREKLWEDRLNRETNLVEDLRRLEEYERLAQIAADDGVIDDQD